MWDGEPWFNKRTQGIEIEKVLEEVHSRSQRATWGGQGRMKAETEQDLDHVLLLGSVGRVLWGSQAKAELVNSNHKKQGFVSSETVLSKEGMGEGPGSKGTML